MIWWIESSFMYILDFSVRLLKLLKWRSEGDHVGSAASFTTTLIMDIENHKIITEEKSLQNENECDIFQGKLGSTLLIIMRELTCICRQI